MAVLQSFKSKSERVIAAVLLVFVTYANAALGADGTCKWDEDVHHWDGFQRDLNQCAADRLSHAEETMNHTYQQQMNYLTEPKLKAQLEKSQKAWLIYREDACRYETLEHDGGTITPMEDGLCKADLTIERTRHLESYLDCREDDCPH